MNALRLILAALGCFVVLLTASGVAFQVFPTNTSPLLMGLTLGGMLIACSLLAARFLGGKGRHYAPGPTLAELEAKGLVSSMNYAATRVFAVEEFEDEGPHYFIELSNGSVLYLNGHYLDDWSLGEPEKSGELRAFPNTDFTIRRHRTDGCVLEILSRGKVLEPELTAPPFTSRDHAAGQVPKDGELITDRSFDALKAGCMVRRRA